MKIVNVSGRELTERETASINQFRSYTDGVSFACLREGVMVMLNDEPGKDVEMLKKTAFDHMEEALCTHPDISTYSMDDGCTMICLPAGIFAIGNDDDTSFPAVLTLRQAALEACEQGEIIAIAFEED